MLVHSQSAEKFFISLTTNLVACIMTKSKVNAAGNYTKPTVRKALFNSIKSKAVQGTAAGQWSARKAQLLAKQYKAKGGGYKD
jgi:hypothetical protein